MKLSEIDRMVMEYLERGGKITGCKYRRPRKEERSYHSIRADISYRGHQSKALRDSGYAKAVG